MSKELGMLLIGFVIGAAVFGIISAIIDAHNTPLIDVKEQKLDSMRITLDLIFKRVLLIEKKLGINKEVEAFILFYNFNNHKSNEYDYDQEFVDYILELFRKRLGEWFMKYITKVIKKLFGKQSPSRQHIKIGKKLSLGTVEIIQKCTNNNINKLGE